jgi:hypothetical protein
MEKKAFGVWKVTNGKAVMVRTASIQLLERVGGGEYNLYVGNSLKKRDEGVRFLQFASSRMNQKARMLKGIKDAEQSA